MTQGPTSVLLAIFGLTSLWWSMGSNPRLRKWAPIVGLCGQPAWMYFAWQTQADGLYLLVLAYSAVYVRGAWVQWRVKL
ncbi:MAG: hypothetical protein H7255_09020 [Ramlibacter sp.]|nr:hypothetical protein [Ramlibacter sp.]